MICYSLHLNEIYLIYIIYYRRLGPQGEMGFVNFFNLCLEFSPLYSPRQLFEDWLHEVRNNRHSDGLSTDSYRGWLHPDDSILTTYPGEIKMATIDNLRWTLNTGIHSSYQFSKRSKLPVFSGILYITNYRLVLMDWRRFQTEQPEENTCRFRIPPFFHELTIPLNSVRGIEYIENHLKLNVADNRFIQIRSLVHNSNPNNSMETLHGQLQKSLAKELSNNCFAFRYRKMYSVEGWDYADIRNEYQRVGLTDGRFWQVRITLL